MAQLPASYPSIPYLGAIPGGLYHGLMLRINGEMNHHDRFNVDIKTGPILQPLDDTNLHLSVRPHENAIVRNSMIHQGWGPEERHGGCPIGYGQAFEMLILAESDQFKVAINGRHFCEFRHRMPLSSARFIYISGQVKIFSIKLEGDPNSVSPSAPIMPTMMPTMPPYQQPEYQPPYQSSQQFPSYQPPPYPTQPNPYGSMSSTITAMPSNNPPSYPSGQYPPQQTVYYETQQQNLDYPSNAPPYQTYQTTTATQPYTAPKNSSSGSTALKYAAGIGAAGLGAYALTQMLSSDSSDSSSSDSD